MDEIQFTRDLLVSNKELVYTGIFKLDDLYKDINRVVEARGYTQREKRSEEAVAEAGRKIYLELRPYKFFTPEIKLLIKIKIDLGPVSESKHQGELYQRGDVRIVLDAWYMTNYRKRWYNKPLTYFLKGVINKYLYQWPEEKDSREMLVSDAAAIYAVIKKLFRTYQPEAKKYSSEEEVIQEVEKEIGKG
ncbi:hypothetical protein J4479_03280 [Candidatus Woesearchaeota archaeon]|nr:hypothetical protein [Candidatus Woesearchaeota archaeon]